MLAKERFYLGDKASQIDDRSISLRWSETGFLNTLPSFLQRDKDILGLAEATLFEEERRRMLEVEVEKKMEEIAAKIATCKRRSGF